jgi:hypothetical protein
VSSPIVAFVTIFLGLTLGPHPVEVLVSDEVARVEVWLDERHVGSLASPPWSLSVDFGSELEPHHLEAVAFDAGGAELTRVAQWVNLPTATAEANLVIERQDDGSAFARLTWANIMGDEPASVALSLDGQPLEVGDPRRIALPPHDPAQLHFLRAELQFEHNVSVVEEVTFGGSYGDRLSTDLTALPVVLTGGGRGAALPEIAALEGWFLSGEEPALVAAVDEGPAEITLIRDRAVQPTLERVVAASLPRGPSGGSVNRTFFSRFDASLKEGQKLAFFWPFMTQSPSGRWMFPAPMGWMTPRDGGVGWFLATVRPPAPPTGEQLLADAVAVAGMNALSRNRRRAVVLILGPAPEDFSRLSAATVRRYLETLRVPLFVWSPDRELATDWGEVRDISNQARLRRAVSELVEQLERQRIVWLHGRHLPQRVRLSGLAANVDFPG